MRRLHTLSLEQKEDVRHGEAAFPIQKYISTLTPDYPVVTTHWHDEAEFTLITDGDAEYQINLSPFCVKPGDLIFIPPRLLHSVNRGTEKRFQSETYVFHMNFPGGNATDICSTRYLIPLINAEITVPRHIPPSHPAYTRLREIFSQISELFNSPVEGYELAIKAELLLLIFTLLQYSDKSKAPSGTDIASDKLKSVIDYIHLHYSEPISIEQLAEQCYFSEYYFMRFFRKHMSMTAIEYINNLRLEKAIEMFKDGETSVLDVSVAVGFGNLSYFYKLFHRKFRMTPREFIKGLSPS